MMQRAHDAPPQRGPPECRQSAQRCNAGGRAAVQAQRRGSLRMHPAPIDRRAPRRRRRCCPVRFMLLQEQLRYDVWSGSLDSLIQHNEQDGQLFFFGLNQFS